MHMRTSYIHCGPPCSLLIQFLKWWHTYHKRPSSQHHLLLALFWLLLTVWACNEPSGANVTN